MYVLVSGLCKDRLMDWGGGGDIVKFCISTLYELCGKNCKFPHVHLDRFGLGVNHRLQSTVDWRWPLSCVHSVMMVVFLAQLAEGGGHAHCPLLVYPLHSSYVAHSPARLARYCYTYCPSHLLSGVDILTA